MQACVLHGVGDIRCEEVDQPTPRAGEVLVRVCACGVCGSDLPRIFSKGTYHFPTIPGHEFAGVVAAIGEGVDPAWLEKRVAVFPLIPCRRCAACETGAYAQCAAYDYLGSRSDGAFADYVVAPEWNLIEAPEAISLEEAAMVEPAAVALHAVRRGKIEAGDAVVIFGAGPIGLMVANWARLSGAGRVMLVDVAVEQLHFAQGLGFPHGFDARSGDPLAWVQEECGGADVVIEASGSPKAFEQAVQCARRFGTVVLLGNPAGAMTLSQAAYWAVMRQELRLLGAWNSCYAPAPKNEWRVALEAMAAGRLELSPLISHRCSLDTLVAHLEGMHSGRLAYRKVMMVNVP